MTDAELLDWVDANNITIAASSQVGYKRWQITHLARSTNEWGLGDSHASLREALTAAKQRFDATSGVQPARSDA